MTDLVLPAISLWQPWGDLIFTGHKLHETRGWKLPDRYMGQLVAIHAARRPVGRLDDDLEALCCEAFGGDGFWRGERAYGALLGTVRFDGWWRTEIADTRTRANRLAGDWTPGRFAWSIYEPRRLLRPIPWLGRQGWFQARIPSDAATVAVEQLGAARG